MNRKTEIRKLLDLYYLEKINPDEIRQLYQFIKQDQDSIEDIISEDWEHVPALSEIPDSQKLIAQLHSKMAFEDHQEDQFVKKEAGFRLSHVWKYAAIFILGFGLSWIVFHHITKTSIVTKSSRFFNVQVAYGSKSSIELPDGSVVKLNSGSTLSYPSDFSAENRKVKLTGEGYFEVKKDPQRPFLVLTNDLTVRVLGTKFNLKSYPEENTTETTLITGKVEILENQADELKTNISKNSTIILSPNEKAVFYRKGIPGIKDANDSKTDSISSAFSFIQHFNVYKEVRSDQEIAWKNNVLLFRADKFSDIIVKLERWYNVDILLAYPELSNVVFSGKFDGESIQEVLHALSLIQEFKFKITKNQIIIFRK